MNQEGLNRALQVSSPVFHIGAFREQVALAGLGNSENEGLFSGGEHDALLYLSEFQIQDPAQFVLSQRLKDYRLIYSVHELGREFTPCSFNPSPGHLLSDLLIVQILF